MIRTTFILLVFLCATARFTYAQVPTIEHILKQANDRVFESPDSAALLVHDAIRQAEALNNDTLAARGYHILGLSHAILGRYATSLEWSLKALDIFERYHLIRRQSATISNIAGVIIEEGRYAEAIVYLKRALVVDQQLLDSAGVASDFNNIAVAFRKMNQLDSAAFYFNQSLHLALSLANPRHRDDAAAHARYNLAFIAIKQKEYTLARRYLDEAHQHYRTHHDDYALCYGAWYEAYLNLETGSYRAAVQWAEQGLHEARRLHLDTERIELYQILSEAHAALHQYDRALVYQQQHEALSDSVYSREKARVVAELQYVYETEQKDQEILLLKKEEQRRRFISVVTGITALAAMLLVLVIYLSKKLQLVRHRAREAALVAAHEKAVHEKYQAEAETALQEEKNKQLQLELESSQRELAGTALFIQQKNTLMEHLQQELARLNAATGSRELLDMSRNLQQHMNFEGDWDKVMIHFERVHPQFFNKLKAICPDLTMNELRQAAYIRINMTNKEVANLLNIDDASVKMSRYRLKKKLKLSPEASLTSFIMSIA